MPLDPNIYGIPWVVITFLFCLMSIYAISATDGT